MFERAASTRAQAANARSRALAGSLLLHTTLGALLVWTAQRLVFPAPAQVYRVDLVAPPAPRTPEVMRPAAEREAPKPPPKEEPAPRAKVRKTPETAPAKAEAPPKEAEAKPPESKPTLEPPTAEETIRLEGAPFPYPEYLNNLVIQVKRRWRPPSGVQRWTAEISFIIHRDGRVTDIEWVRRSGSFGFDLEARGAVETAARQQAFGPLPEGYPADQLRVVFLFDPARY